MVLEATPTTRIDAQRWSVHPLLSPVLVGAALVAVMAMAITGEPGAIGEAMEDQFGSWLPFFYSVQFLVIIPVLFLLEWRWPAIPDQRGISPAVAYEAFYMVVHLPFIVAVAAVLAGPIVRFLEANASGLVVDSTRDWPVLLVALIGVAIVDFGNWFAHLVKHKVPLFWRFHMIHHSQTRMSVFTANRSHPVDALVSKFILLLPFFFLFPSFIEQRHNVLLLLPLGWWERIQHTNIRTNFGPLRWLFVTPQSHRIHHSTEPEHWNSNFAAIFAWDRLFGTQHPDDTSYPTTGINDPHFPEPTRWSPIDFASSFIGQMLFPFDREAVRRASTGSPHDATRVAD